MRHGVPFLLDIEQHHSISILQQQASSASIENVVTVWHLYFLGYFILQVPDNQLQQNKNKTCQLQQTFDSTSSQRASDMPPVLTQAYYKTLSMKNQFSEYVNSDSNRLSDS